MKHVTIGLLSALVLATAQAQTTGAVLAPNPVTVAVTVGHWMLKDRSKVFYVEIQSEGNTFETAKNEAFRLAVEKAVGSLVLAESELKNSNLQRHEIISYASGYIDDFEIVSRNSVNGRERLTMKIWVGESRIANRLLNRSESTNTIDPKLSVRVESVLNERYTGDRVLNAVLADYPKRAFDITPGVNHVELNSQRQVVLTIPFSIKWNYDYLVSLYEALDTTSQRQIFCQTDDYKCSNLARSQSFFHIRAKPPGNWVRSWTANIAFDDGYKSQSMYNTFIGTSPAVLLILRNTNGQEVRKQCYRWAELDHNVSFQYPTKYLFTVNGNHSGIDGNFTLEGKIELNYNQKTDQFSQLEKIELSVVKGNQCPI